MEGFIASFRDMWDHGGPILIPLLLASILGLAVIIDRTLVFALAYENFRRLVRRLEPLVRAHRWTEAERLCTGRGPATQLARIYIEHRDQPEKMRENILSREGSYILAHLEKRLRMLAALGQIATLLGLLGTFYFLIVRLTPAATGAGQIQQADFVTAIWESFLSTMIGLAIAIPCMIVFQFCEARVDAVARQLSGIVSHLDEWRASSEPAPLPPVPQPVAAGVRSVK